jgi:hypothetical protein
MSGTISVLETSCVGLGGRQRRPSRAILDVLGMMHLALRYLMDQMALLSLDLSLCPVLSSSFVVEYCSVVFPFQSLRSSPVVYRLQSSLTSDYSVERFVQPLHVLAREKVLIIASRAIRILYIIFDIDVAPYFSLSALLQQLHFATSCGEGQNDQTTRCSMLIRMRCIESRQIGDHMEPRAILGPILLKVDSLSLIEIEILKSGPNRVTCCGY